ncbi:hypothetical protein AB0F46_41325 [Streptomyces sp. NPDC026665]|uniref:hypothetical protein n=1 Tax=Streptomyces sp. NPDC026665 TaxID=3154798 RepID=UPI003400F232
MSWRRAGLQPEATPEQVRERLTWTQGELAGARRTVQHMSNAMSWISGHDRQGLDHLNDAVRANRARERAVSEARRWAARARATEAALQQIVEDLESEEAYGGAYDSNHEAARRIRALLDKAQET